MMVSDGTENLLRIMDIQDDNTPQGLSTVTTTKSCGLRHSAFYTSDRKYPTHYFALCQFTRELLSLKIELHR